MKTWQRRILGILTLGGGAVGFTVAASLLTTLSGMNAVLCVAIIALYAWGVWCGIKMLECQPGWEGPAIGYWMAQIPAFGSPLLGYFVSSGFHVTTTMQFSPWQFDINFLVGSTFSYSFMHPEQPWLVGVNLFALAVVMWLMRSRRQTAQTAA